jgi:hypothetical protein
MHQGSAFWYFRRQEVGVLCYGIPKVVKHDTTIEEDVTKDFDNSTFRVSKVVETGNLTTRIVILQNPKSRFGRGRDHIIGQEIWVDA